MGSVRSIWPPALKMAMVSNLMAKTALTATVSLKMAMTPPTVEKNTTQNLKPTNIITSEDPCYSIVPKRVLILRTWSLIRTFLAFWVLIGSLFIFQGPYFHYFGFIHAKNVKIVSYLQALVPVYTVGKF